MTDDTDVSHLYEDDGAMDETTLESLAGLCSQQMKLEMEYAEIEEKLKAKKDELDNISKKIIPDVMNTLGVSEYKFSDGSTLTLKDGLNVYIAAANKPKAYDWMRENNFGDLIKNEILLKFAAGQEAEAKEVVSKLTSDGYTPEEKEGVHPSTLKAFAKERLEKGEQLPMELFSCFTYQEAKIKQPKN